MFKRIIAIAMMVMALTGCGKIPVIGDAFASSSAEDFTIDMDGFGTLAVTKIEDDKYVMEVKLSEKGCEEYFGDDYGVAATSMTFTAEITKVGYVEVVTDMTDQGYEIQY